MWTLNVSSGDVRWNERQVARLSVSETLVLSLLMSNETILISKDKLLDEGWPNKFVAPNSLTVAIKNIRKIFSSINSSAYIETVHRKGYIFHCENDEFSIIDTKVQEPQATSSVELIAESEDDSKAILPISSTEKNVTIFDKSKTSYLEMSLGILKSCQLPLKIFVFITVVLWAIFIYTSKTDLICYQYHNANLCGAFPLNEESKLLLQRKIGVQSGDFLYGYEKDFTEVKLYKLD